MMRISQRLWGLFAVAIGAAIPLSAGAFGGNECKPQGKHDKTRNCLPLLVIENPPKAKVTDTPRQEKGKAQKGKAGQKKQ